ncbi:unnamed protein product, partial [Cylicostephanus goldi]
KPAEKAIPLEPLKKEAKEDTKKTEKAAPAAKEEDKKVSAESKSLAKEPKAKATDASCYLRPPESGTKDVDSHHDDKEINVEFRTKPVFGRRSKFSEFKQSFMRMDSVSF